MNIYASIAMTFIPLVTVYICFLLLGKDFNKVHKSIKKKKKKKERKKKERNVICERNTYC